MRPQSEKELEAARCYKAVHVKKGNVMYRWFLAVLLLFGFSSNSLGPVYAVDLISKSVSIATLESGTVQSRPVDFSCRAAFDGCGEHVKTNSHPVETAVNETKKAQKCDRKCYNTCVSKCREIEDIEQWEICECSCRQQCDCKECK